MLLSKRPIGTMPSSTIHVAHAAFPKGNRHITLRDELGTIFNDEMFANSIQTIS